MSGPFFSVAPRAVRALQAHLRPNRQRVHRLFAAVLLTSVAAPGAFAQSAACQVTYKKTWEGGNGFGAELAIQNTGTAAITNGWTLIFSFPNSQRLQNGWPVAFTQPASSAQMTIASNADWNKVIGSGATFIVGFNGTFSGANDLPTAFMLNGVSCGSGGGGGGGGNTPPILSMTSPTSGQSFQAGSNVTLAASASDPGGAITSVEFRVDGVLRHTATSAPFSFTVTGLPSGNHTARATAFDNGTPMLSSSLDVPFTIQGPPQLSLSLTPSTLTMPGGGSGGAMIRLSATPANPVTATITCTGTVITPTPTSVTLSNANWSTGASVTFTAAAGPTAASSTCTATATGYAPASISVARSGVGRVDNPYSDADGYNNPQWRANAVAHGGSAIAHQPTAVWMDRISAITGNGSATTGSMGLADHLDQAVLQDQANGARALTFQLVIYNLPGRDCSALASNGELGPTELPRYKAEYIDVIAAILRRPAYANLRIVTIVEIDSLPNLVTNTTSRVTGTPQCDVMAQNGGYVNGVGYALATLGAVPNVYNYVDAGHHGWLGWDTNLNPSVDMMKTAATASGSTLENVHGFVTNTANTSALQEPYIPFDNTTRPSRWIDWNQFNDELSYAQAFRARAVAVGFRSDIGMLIDTSRNGWGGPARPTGRSTLPVLNDWVDASRIDRRIHKGNWCNPAGAGLGERPRAAPAAGIDAYVWIKPPGESDGSSTFIANTEGKGFDRMCDPTYGGNARNNNNATGALPNAPLSGHWFPEQFQELLRNAFPPL